VIQGFLCEPSRVIGRMSGALSTSFGSSFVCIALPRIAPTPARPHRGQNFHAHSSAASHSRAQVREFSSSFGLGQSAA